MRTFACKSLGNNCSWKYVANTEELLTDIVAMHLREVHGVKAVTPELIDRVKNQFANAAPMDAGTADRLEMKEVRCQDLGNKCAWRYLAQTEELLVDGAAVHTREVHGIGEFTPEMIARVKKAAHPWNMEGELAKKIA